MTILTPEEVQAALKKLPAVDHHGERVEHAADGELRMRLPFISAYVGSDEWHGGGGAIYSGAMVLGFADTAMYACILSTFGGRVLGVIQSMTTNFLRPVRPVDLIAQVRIIRRGKHSLYLEAFLYSDGDAEPAAHVTATAILRPIGGGWQSSKQV